MSLILLAGPTTVLAQSNTFGGTVSVLKNPESISPGYFDAPNAVAVTPGGTLVVADCISQQTTTTAGTVTNTSTELWEILSSPAGVGQGTPTVVNRQIPNCVQALAFDLQENMYFSVFGSGDVMEIKNGNFYSASPVPLTLSPQFQSISRIAMDIKGNLFVADDGAQTITEFPMVNGTVSPTMSNQWTATSKLLPVSRSIAMATDNAGDLYVLDGSNTLREVVASNGVLNAATSPVMQIGPTFGGALAVSIGQNGNVFVAERSTSNGVYVVEFPSTGTNTFGPMTYIADGAIDHPFSISNGVLVGEQLGLAADGWGDVFVADSGNGRTLAFNINSPANFGAQTLNAGETSQSLSFLYFADVTNVKPLGPITLYTVVNGKNVPSLDFFDAGTGTCRANLGNTQTTGNTCTIDVIFKPSTFGTINGLVVASAASTGSPTLFSAAMTGVGVAAQTVVGSGFDHPEGLGISTTGGVLVADTLNRRIATLGTSGSNSTVLPQVVPFGNFAVDANGNIFFADMRNNAVKELNPTTHVLTSLGSGWSGPRGVAIDANGTLYVADSNNSAVKTMTRNSDLSYASPVVLPGSPLVGYPTGVAVDNNTKDVFVADPTRNVVMRFITVGTMAGTMSLIGSGFKTPYGVAVDPSSNVFVADSGNNAVEEIMAAGGFTQIQTVWPASAGANYPMAIIIDSQGDVFVADTGNGRVVELTVNVAFPVK
jgi:sugar lactone lactonase YvrE